MTIWLWQVHGKKKWAAYFGKKVLFILEGDEWRELRGLMRPAFMNHNLSTLAERPIFFCFFFFSDRRARRAPNGDNAARPRGRSWKGMRSWRVVVETPRPMASLAIPVLDLRDPPHRSRRI